MILREVNYLDVLKRNMKVKEKPNPEFLTEGATSDLIERFKKAASRTDVKNMKEVLKPVPSVPLARIKEQARRRIKDFDSNYKIAKRELEKAKVKNGEKVEHAAVTIAIALENSKNPEEDARSRIEKTKIKLRKNPKPYAVIGGVIGGYVAAIIIDSFLGLFGFNITIKNKSIGSVVMMMMIAKSLFDVLFETEE